MGKKLVKIAILLVVAGVAFGGSFVASMTLHKKGVTEEAAAQPGAQAPSGFKNEPGPVILPRALRDEQIDALARNLREAMTKVIDKEAKLEGRQEQMDTIQAQMETDRRELESLYARVMGAVVELKKERAEAESQVIRMTAEEEARLAQMAEIYDQMESTKSSMMIETMYAGAQREDAIKILFFMNPRTAAETLGAIENTQLGAAIVDDFKRVKELASTGE